MLTRTGHMVAAYVLVALGLCHWLRGHRLAADELAAAAAPAAGDDEAD